MSSIIITVLSLEISANWLKYFTTGSLRWFPSIKTRPGLTPVSAKPGKTSSKGPSKILILSRPASLKFCLAISAVSLQPSIVKIVVSVEAAMYIVLIPKDVPNSIISGLPNSVAIFDNNLAYFSGTGEYLAISDTLLTFVFAKSDREPRSVTNTDLLSQIIFFLTFSIVETISGSTLFRKTLDTRSKANGL